MKRITLLLSLGLGVLLLAGCNDVKRKLKDTARGVEEHAQSKILGTMQDKGDEAVNKGAEAATGDDKQAKDRNALKGNDDDSDK